MKLDSNTRHGRIGRGGLLATLALLAACDDGGGGGRGGGGGGGGGRQPLAVDFALRTDLRLGSAFLGDVLHVDLDDDGIQDLVEANFGTRFVTVALGLFDGTFTTVAELATAGHSWRLATGDFDGDGMLDIAVACGDWVDGADQAVQIFEQGPAPGEFGAPATFHLDTDPKDLCAVPVSGLAGDPGPDELFVALRDEEQVIRLSLDAGGQLVQTGMLDSSALGTAGGPFSIAALDLGGDGWIDLVAGEELLSGDRVIEYPRTAAGFQDALLVTEPVFKPVVDAVGDVDGNGFDDLAVAQVEATDVLLLAGDAAGLSQMHVIDFGGETSSLLFPDLDGDGLCEAVATVLFQDAIQVHRGVAPFTWDAPVNYNVGLAPRALGVLELPGDGVPDLLCANAQDLSLLVGLGDGSFRCARGYSTGLQSPVAVEMADMDVDGDLDAVAISRFQETLIFLEGSGDGNLVTRNVLDLMPTVEDDSGYLALSDIDGDGLVDVLATVLERDELRLYRNLGAIERFKDPEAADMLAIGDGPLGMDLGDLDDDGAIDVVVGNVNSRTLQVCLGDGEGSFVPQEPLALPFTPQAIACADLDGDGAIDVALAARDDSDGRRWLALLAGDGSGALELGPTFELPGVPGGIATGDLDEDGRLDVVVGQLEVAVDTLPIFLNRDAFLFEPLLLPVSSGPGTPIMADIDRDGHLDVLVATTDGELKLVFGDGAGAFRSIEPLVRGALPCAEGTLSAALGDLDGDELPELLMVSPGAPFVWVATNASLPLEMD